MPDDPDKTSCHELHVLATNGRVFLLRVDDVDRLFLNRIFVTALAVYCIVLALVDPQVFGVHVSLPLRCLFWCVSALALVFFIGVLFRFFAWLYCWRGWKRAFPTALMLLMATAAAQVVYHIVGTRVFGLTNIWGGSILGEFLRYGLVVIAFELLLSTIIFPKEFEDISRYNEARAQERVRWGRRQDEEYRDMEQASPSVEGSMHVQGAGASGDHGTGANPNGADPSRTLSVGRQKFPVNMLIYLKSIEHYVELVTHDGVETIRVALRDLTDQLDDEDGVQPHRSYWVARDAIVGLVKTGGNAFLLLRDGSEIPVARHRRQDVTAWISEHIG